MGPEPSNARVYPPLSDPCFARRIPPHPPLRLAGKCAPQSQYRKGPRVTWGRTGQKRRSANRRDHPTYAPRTMPRLRRANAHHRDLQAGAKATDPRATTTGRRMTRCPPKCTIPAPLCASSGWNILLPQTIQYIENAPMFIVINAKIMPPMAFEPPRMPSTNAPGPKPTYSSLALSP
jgi:hypothetical protein